MAAVLAGYTTWGVEWALALRCAVTHGVVKVIDSQVSPPLLILPEPLRISVPFALYLLYCNSR